MAKKTLGIVRRLDDLGRVTLPIELRRTFGIEEKDQIEIYVEGDAICLKPVKVSPERCVLCGSETNLIELNGNKVCRECIARAVDLL